jgi:hypothetical protein
VFLFIPATILSGRIAQLNKDNLKAQAALNQISPGISGETLEQFKDQINKLLETQLLPLAYLFDPPEKEIKEDYDPSIYFVDELGKTNQFLKTKAISKQLSYTDLGFKEKLPEEKEARYLLKQLYTLRDLVNKGIDCDVNFISVVPQPQEEIPDLTGVKMMKARLELSAPASALLEFIIQVSQTVPLISLESVVLKAQDSVFKSEVTLSQTLIEAPWKDRGIPFNPLNTKDIFSGQEKFVNILRGNNPFSLPKPAESQATPLQAPAQQPKESPRFLYRGKAMLKAKEVAIIEDTLNKKTVFVAPQDRIGDFTLKELKAQEIILKNVNDGKEITIKREIK